MIIVDRKFVIKTRKKNQLLKNLTTIYALFVIIRI